jgi:hypothetical protein
MKKKTTREFFYVKHLKRTAEQNSNKLCKGSLPELCIPYYKTFQVDFLTQICDKTQTYIYTLCKTQICVYTEYVFQVAPSELRV